MSANLQPATLLPVVRGVEVVMGVKVHSSLTLQWGLAGGALNDLLMLRPSRTPGTVGQTLEPTQPSQTSNAGMKLAFMH